MTKSIIERIETDIEKLSVSEQLWLMERLAYRIRQSSLRRLDVQESDLIAMAADPTIQSEIRQINTEFTATELDGLDHQQ